MPQDNLLPPGADSKKAEKYVTTLCDLISQDKLTVTQTDLSRFSSNSMEDHYRLNLTDYDVELSHNRNPETKEETFIMIFNSVSHFDNASPKPLILSYMHLTNEQFLKLKEASDAQIERNRKKEEEQRFSRTMEPIDSLLEQLKGSGQPGKSEDYLVNAQPVSSSSDWTQTETPQSQMQTDAPQPEIAQSAPINPAPPMTSTQPELTPEEPQATPESPAEAKTDDSSMPL